MTKRIADLPKHDRPREKMQSKGAIALSDEELVAILLGFGTKGHDVMSVAKRIVRLVDDHHGRPDLADLQRLEGVGPAKATLIAAALEFARRRIRPEGVKIKTPLDVLPEVRHYADRKQEHFLCISLNGAHEIIATRVVSIGLVNKTQVHPREVFADPITDRASAVVLAHNHPSSDLTPSKEDILLTRQLKEAGETLGITVLDHIIFSQKGHYSFLENGCL
ncbi:RadC family protein [Desulfoferrobacter suflitae]|uniref:RadC family protein n=1 Tax=Desulfoferrobacter suflitae TaxID=2865782 RepID=UPI00216434A6|nr:DNA repair protein RadC [Desulfoferrobacter suflitae]MCK8601360.1 DNA repair protein RadC [Desulfoferrobacter suflitae]